MRTVKNNNIRFILMDLGNSCNIKPPIYINPNQTHLLQNLDQMSSAEDSSSKE